MNIKPNRAPGTIWAFRRPKSGQSYVPRPWVRTMADDNIVIELSPMQSFRLTRKDARLLAKRLNECLDATATR